MLRLIARRDHSSHSSRLAPLTAFNSSDEDQAGQILEESGDEGQTPKGKRLLKIFQPLVNGMIDQASETERHGSWSSHPFATLRLSPCVDMLLLGVFSQIVILLSVRR